MSALLGVFSPAGNLPDEETVRRMLEPMRARGAETSSVYRDESALLVVSRYGWEMETGFSGPALVVKEGDVVVTADASLYYRADLIRKLHGCGIHATGGTPSHLILAAYRAWGERCAEHLEGDFAFILWDGRTRTICCSRDFAGTRPLYYAETGGVLVVASTVGSVRAHPHCPADLNLAAIAATAGGLFAAGHETCYKAVFLLPAGYTLSRSAEQSARLVRHWHPPPINSGDATPFEDAADELRELLGGAVAERFSPREPTSVWLSGGWDSTSIFASGERVLGDRGEGKHLHAVSISYPAGDPGREDELIQAVAGRWQSPIRWLQVDGIPLFDHPHESAAARDEPFAHAFERWNRALAGASRDAGARVALNGNGGDQFFSVSPIYLADLFGSGRWMDLAREWKTNGMSGGGFRTFFRWAVQPVLPSPVLKMAATLRGGRPLRGYLERGLPEWMDGDFVRRNRLRERERLNVPPRAVKGHAGYEMYWYMVHEFFARINATIFQFGIEGGLEVRSPLLDERVARFAASRPTRERGSGGESKCLLRASMRGLLPNHVLVPRPYRTGGTGSYFQRFMRKTHAAFVTEVLDAPLALADLGIVRPQALRRGWRDYLRGGDGNLALNLFFTLQTELWLRARIGTRLVRDR